MKSFFSSVKKGEAKPAPPSWKWLLLMFNGRTAMICEAQVENFRELPPSFDVRRVTQTRVAEHPDSIKERGEIMKDIQERFKIGKRLRKNEHEVMLLQNKMQEEMTQKIDALPKRGPITIPFADPLYASMEGTHSIRSVGVCSVSEIPQALAESCSKVWIELETKRAEEKFEAAAIAIGETAEPTPDEKAKSSVLVMP